LHFAVGRYIRRALIQSAWDRGFVHIKLLGDLPVGAGQLNEARLAARYLGKYLSKDVESDWGGLHRYEVAQGFQPHREQVTAQTGRDALAELSVRMTRAPEYVWWSSEATEWHGPPAVWASWAA
jgi:hypothetical protein